jgi:hypothetical protein
MFSILFGCVTNVNNTTVLASFLKPHRLHDFFIFLGAPLPADAAEQKWLFPFGLQLIGWNHQFDLVVKVPLSYVRWWPGFLDSLKALVSFLRSHTLRPAMIRGLEDSGKHGLAAVIRELSLPTFAQWRWRTLEAVCIQLNKCLRALCEHFDSSWFIQTTRTSVEFKKVAAALGSSTFSCLFAFVLWFAVWIGGIQGICKQH